MSAGYRETTKRAAVSQENCDYPGLEMGRIASQSVGFVGERGQARDRKQAVLEEYCRLRGMPV